MMTKNFSSDQDLSQQCFTKLYTANATFLHSHYSELSDKLILILHIHFIKKYFWTVIYAQP